ncbi:thiolase family protein [Kaustia mangrovi]|uniref:thiolase family protein n=1 Tax=Kaustia mangrovi TaxID=2593653 RepID=UPI001FE6A2F2|nr:thiolase family protein [Kaustia mangrovi]
MTVRPVIAAARRTAVAPRGGAFAHLGVDALAAPVIAACLADAGLAPGDVDHVVLGNGLYGGGNPARFASLGAGLPETVPALTFDTQCCAGLDAIALAARLVASGAAETVLAGGVESWSRAPIRMTRPIAGEAPVAYDRPPFAPDAAKDVDMTDAAAALAAAHGVTRKAQEAFAVESHRRALAAQGAGRFAGEIVAQDLPLGSDAFTRRLTPALCARLPAIGGSTHHGERSPPHPAPGRSASFSLSPGGRGRDPAPEGDGTVRGLALAGTQDCAITAATAAVEADAAAVVVVTSRRRAPQGLGIVDAISLGGDPAMPALAPVPAIAALLERNGLVPVDLAAVELMEAYAAQAMVDICETGLDPSRVNRCGGALARGHPIGASGAILAVRLWHELAGEGPGAIGLAAIAGAGGLASAMLIRRER